MTVFWNQLNDSISGYVVAYMKLKSPESNCSSDEVTEVAGGMNNAVLVGLKPYTEYTVTVKSDSGRWGKAVTARTGE